MSHPFINLSDSEKLALQREHDIGGVDWQSLQDRAFCLHCDQSFTGEQVRVYADEANGELMLECGTANCDGSPLDWSRKPWSRGRAKRWRLVGLVRKKLFVRCAFFAHFHEMKIIKIIFAVLAALWGLALVPKLLSGISHSNGDLAASHILGSVAGILIAAAISITLFRSASNG